MNTILKQALRTPASNIKNILKIFWPIAVLIPILSILTVSITQIYPEFINPAGATLLLIIYFLCLFSQGFINWHNTIIGKQPAKPLSPIPALASLKFTFYLINFMGMTIVVGWIVSHLESYNNWYTTLISAFFSICLGSYLIIAICKREFLSLPRIAEGQKRNSELTAKIVKLTNSPSWTQNLLLLLIAFEISLYTIPIFLLFSGFSESLLLLSLIVIGVILSTCYFSLTVMSYLSLSYKSINEK